MLQLLLLHLLLLQLLLAAALAQRLFVAKRLVLGDPAAVAHVADAYAAAPPAVAASAAAICCQFRMTQPSPCSSLPNFLLLAPLLPAPGSKFQTHTPTNLLFTKAIKSAHLR